MAEVCGPAASRAELSAGGAAEPPTPQPVSGRSQLVAAGWQQLVLEVISGTHRDARTLKKLTRNVVWLFGFLALCGVVRWCEVTADLTLRWCWAGVQGPDGTWREASVSTARNRQWVAQTVFAIAAELGAQIDPHTAAGPKIERKPPVARAGPVTASEFRRIRGNADPGGSPSRRSVAVALFSSGASAIEAGDVRRQDIDLEARTVKLAGPAARVCTLDEWSAGTIDRYLRAHPDTAPDERLCVADTTPREFAAQAISTQLCSVINQAGFADRPDISGRSIRLTAAHRVLERDGIEAAARFLGSPSLDNTAEALGYDWQRSAVAEPLGRGRRTTADPSKPRREGQRWLSHASPAGCRSSTGNRSTRTNSPN